MKYLNNYQQLLEEKNIGTLYHFTNLISLYMIIREDSLVSNRSVESCENLLQSYNLYDKQNWYYISFTRNKNFHITSSGNIDSPITCSISIDGNKLSNYYKLYPINYFDSDYNTFEEKEAEECIVVEDDLPKLSKYILSVKIPTFEAFKKEIEDGSSDEYQNKLESISEFLNIRDEYDDFVYDENKVEPFCEKLYGEIVDFLEHNLGELDFLK